MVFLLCVACWLEGGTGSGDVNVRHFTTIEEGLENAGFTITTKDWLDQYTIYRNETKKRVIAEITQKAKEAGVNPMFWAMGATYPEPEYTLPIQKNAEVAVYVLARNSGEGNDRKIEGDIKLTETEIRDILKISELYENFMLVLNVGGLVDLSPVQEVKNILLLSQLGTPTGEVLADLLTGKAYPSGKLTMTWANIEDYPSTNGFGDINDTFYKEGIYVGYRYFDSVDKTPNYPFGYGLTYTEFEISPDKFQADEKEVTAYVAVKNTGAFPGKEVVQLYYSAPQGLLDKPYQELATFAKTVELAPGDEQIIKLSFPTEAMRSFDAKNSSYILEAGNYVIRVGNSSRSTKIAGVVALDKNAIVERTKPICTGWEFTDFRPTEVRQEEALYGTPLCELDASLFAEKTHSYQELPKAVKATEGVTWQQVLTGEATMDEYIGGLSNRQLAYLCIGKYNEVAKGVADVIGQAASWVAGAAGETTAYLKDTGLDFLVMADGPAGLRLATKYKALQDHTKSIDSAAIAMFEDFMDAETLEQIRMMQQNETPEEQEAPICYQYCVAIPIGTALAQSFNESVWKTCGDIVAEEMELFGVHLWLAPAMNIYRSPLCGRNFEYYSEDPLVSGKVAAAITQSVQRHKGCGTTIKHYCCNNQETNRYGSNSVVSERALREIYLRGFEICVKEAQPETLMTSYNLVNGEHSCSSKDLMTYVLRDEWGYEGFVMTDWLVTTDLMINPAGKHTYASAAGCLKAGNDLIMPGGNSDRDDILAAVENEEHAYPLSRAEMELCARRILRAIMRMTA